MDAQAVAQGQRERVIGPQGVPLDDGELEAGGKQREDVCALHRRHVLAHARAAGGQGAMVAALLYVIACSQALATPPMD